MMETKATSKQWYIVHTYSGFEKKVSESLRQRAKAYGLDDHIGRIEIPTEEVVEMKGGKKVQTATRFFPGYILVEIETEEGADGKKIPDSTWHLVKNTPKVTGFVGSGNRPVPLSQEEADQIFVQVKESIEKPKPKYTFERGEAVRIIDGPFSNFQGVVEEVNLDRNTLNVMLTSLAKTPPVAVLIKRAVGIAKGSGEPNKNKVGTITQKQVEEIAKLKLPDLNAESLQAAVNTVKGTARSMGVDVV